MNYDMMIEHHTNIANVIWIKVLEYDMRNTCNSIISHKSIIHTFK